MGVFSQAAGKTPTTTTTQTSASKGVFGRAAEKQQPEKGNNMLQKFIVNTIGRPAIRTAEAIVSAPVRAFGGAETNRRLDEQLAQPTKLPLGFGTVGPQKGFGSGGAKQIGVNAAKTALDIFTLGEGGAVNAGLKKGVSKLIGPAAKAVSGTKAGSFLAKNFPGLVSNVTEGLGYTAAQNVLEGEKPTENFGGAGLASAIIPPAIKGIGSTIAKIIPPSVKENIARVLKNTGRKSLSQTASNADLDKAVNGFETIRQNADNIIVKDINDNAKPFNPKKATFFELPQALKQTKDAVYAMYTKIANEAGDLGAKFGQPEFNALQNALDKYSGPGYTPAYSTKAQQFKDALMRFADVNPETGEIAFKSTSPEEIQNLIENVNLDVNPLSDKAGAQVANEFSQELRGILDNKITENGNPAYQEFRDKYAELKSIEQDVIQRYKEALRKANANPNLIDGISSLDAIMGIINMEPTQVLRGGIIQALKRGFKYLRDPEVNLQRAFRLLDQSNGKVPLMPPTTTATERLRLPQGPTITPVRQSPDANQVQMIQGEYVVPERLRLPSPVPQPIRLPAEGILKGQQNLR